MPSHEQTGKDISFSEAVRFWFIDIQVNELTNNGHVIAEFEGSDHYKIVFERFSATAPFQNSGIATRLYEHGDSGNGDPLYPKTWLYLAGWGSDLRQGGAIRKRRTSTCDLNQSVWRSRWKAEVAVSRLVKPRLSHLVPAQPFNILLHDPFSDSALYTLHRF